MADPIATSADYADAMFVARRAKHWLFLILFIMLLVQLTLFFIARYTNLIITGGTPTQPIISPWLDRLHYLSGMTTFLGTVLPPLLAAVLLLIVNIMLIGRLIGVARVTSAFIWCLLLVLLLFPWQAFLNNANFTAADFKIPGVLVTWDELVMNAKFHPDRIEESILKWSRFLVFPLLALILLLIVQIKSNRGLRQALGEGEPEPNITL